MNDISNQSMNKKRIGEVSLLDEEVVRKRVSLLRLREDEEQEEHQPMKKPYETVVLNLGTPNLGRRSIRVSALDSLFDILPPYLADDRITVYPQRNGPPPFVLTPSSFHLSLEQLGIGYEADIVKSR